MKVVVTASGTDSNSPVDPRFGRSQNMVLVDTESGDCQSYDNTQNVNLAQGAGIQAAENVSRLGAEAVITGHCGPKAFRGLQAAGIKIYVGAQGTVAQAIEDLKIGKLTEANAPDVQGHWV